MSLFCPLQIFFSILQAPWLSSKILAHSSSSLRIYFVNALTNTPTLLSIQSTMGGSSSTPVSTVSLAIRLLALGDSITYGYYSSTGNGYRQDLLDLLYASNYANTTYLGTLASGLMTQNHHEGYPGATISVVENAGLKTLNQTLYPNVVLLHAGTNDAIQNHNATTMTSDLRHLLDHIFQLKPNITVILSEVIMHQNSTTEAIIRSFNGMMPNVVQTYVQGGKHVQLVTQDDVDLSTDENPQHLQDAIHPGDIGFAKMARNFFSGLNAAIAKGWVV